LKVCEVCTRRSPKVDERQSLTEKRLARAQREALRNRAQFNARNTTFEGSGILFPEKEVKSEVTPRQIQTGKLNCVALVYRELTTIGRKK
jgi:hypothetical protein